MQLVRYVLARHFSSTVFIAWFAAMCGLYTYHGNTTRAVVYMCFAVGWAAGTHLVAARELRTRSQLAELLEAHEFDAAQEAFDDHLGAFTRPEVKDLQLLLTCAALSPTAVKRNTALLVAIATLRGGKP